MPTKKIPPGIKAIETIGDRAIDKSIPLYKKQVDRWIKDVNEQMDSYDDFDKLKLTPLSKDIRDLIQQVLTLSYLIGNNYAKIDKDEEKRVFIAFSIFLNKFRDTNIDHKFEFAVVTKIDWKIVGFPDAEKLLAAKDVIAANIFKEGSAFLKSIAFSVQRIEDLNAIVLMKESILDSIEKGFVFRDWRDMILPEIFKKAGYIKSKVPALQPWHIETVFRTNQSSVYNSARFENFMKDRNVAAFEYRAVLDDRTRPEHEALDGFTAPKDAPIWDSIFPPNGYNCRCTVVPVTKFRLDSGRQKISKIDDKIKNSAENVHPDFKGKQNLKEIDKRLKVLEKEKIAKINVLDKEINNELTSFTFDENGVKIIFSFSKYMEETMLFDHKDIKHQAEKDWIYLIHHMHPPENPKDMEELHHCIMYEKKGLRGKSFEQKHIKSEDIILHVLKIDNPNNAPGIVYDHLNNGFKIKIEEINGINYAIIFGLISIKDTKWSDQDRK